MSTGLYTPVEGRQGVANGTGYAIADGDLNGLFGTADAQTAYLMKTLVEQTRVTLTVTAPSAGTPRITGTASLPTSVTAPATGTPRVTGTATIPTTLAASSAGTPRVTGAATLPLTITAAATGTPRVTGTAALVVRLTAPAVGTLKIVGTAVLRLGWSVFARGGPRNRRVRVVADHTGPRVRVTDLGDP